MSALQQRSTSKVSLPRRRPYRDTDDVADGVCRLIRAVGRRIANEDPDDLRSLILLDAALRQAWADAIEGLRRSEFTDREIGRVLGTTRQAVEQRWPRRR
jgi:hypothetical protein